MDLAGFTNLSATAAPELVGRFLSEYYRASREAVETAGGHIVQFIGDASFAVFLAPDPRVAVAHASEAAPRMIEAVGSLGRRLSQDYRPRIGMHAGDMLLGPIHDGETYRLYLIGNTINLAARIEGMGKKATDLVLGGSVGRICMSEDVAVLLPAGWRTRVLEEVTIKGSAQAIKIMEVCEIAKPEASGPVS